MSNECCSAENKLNDATVKDIESAIGKPLAFVVAVDAAGNLYPLRG